MDLHELVKLPYGEAKKELIKAGKWDEYAGLKERKWEVALDVTYRKERQETIVVSARCEEEAMEKAENEFRSDCDVIEAEAINAENVS